MTRDPIRFAIVGAGFRSEFYLRQGRDLPNDFEITGLMVRSDKGRAMAAKYGVPVRTSLDEIAADSPEFVVVVVPWEAAPGITTDLVGRGIRVLEETPPAPDAEKMRALWAEVGSSDLVQVGDQTLYMPTHVARWNILRSGVLGAATSVHVSSNHQYHAVALMRGLLGVRGESVTVSARNFTAPVVDPLDFSGWRDSLDPVEHWTALGTIDFGSGRSGLYDFTENQWFNPLRQRRLLVRAVGGEIVDDRAIRMAGPRSILESRIVRRSSGVDLNLQGFALENITFDGTVVFENPHPEASQSDEDIAAAGILSAMSAWGRGTGPAPYPLADGLQDHLIGIAIADSAEARAEVITAVEPWAASMARPTVFYQP